MDVLPSALRHGIGSTDIDHAARNATVVEEVAEDPTRYLVIGPDRAGNLVELVVMDRPKARQSSTLPLRAKYRRLLPQEDHDPNSRT